VIGDEIPRRRNCYQYYKRRIDMVALSDAYGELAAFYEYDACGNTMTEAEKSEVDNPYRYSTKEWDEKSGIYYFGARYYSPEIGRWTQRDPAGTVDGLNLYTHVWNSPVNTLDPWGRRARSREALGEFGKCFFLTYGLMELVVWPLYDIQDMWRHRRFETAMSNVEKRLMSFAVAIAFCSRYLFDPSACFGEEEMLDIAGNIHRVARRYIENPAEAWNVLERTSPELLRAPGLEDLLRHREPMEQRQRQEEQKPEEPPWYLKPFIRQGH
jgi:RHS repeat-associated protein